MVNSRLSTAAAGIAAAAFAWRVGAAGVRELRAPVELASAAGPGAGDGCAIISAGKDATVDGSILTSHSDACSGGR